MTDTTPLQSRVLVTGTNSGLGKYIASQISCAMLTRENSEAVLNETYDTIIHCAFNSRKSVNDYYDVVRDNIFLTKDRNILEFTRINIFYIYNISTKIYLLILWLASYHCKKYDLFSFLIWLEDVFNIGFLFTLKKGIYYSFKDK